MENTLDIVKRTIFKKIVKLTHLKRFAVVFFSF